MSPAGGVGINLAIQDAIAAARLLAQPLLDQSVSEKHLAAVQRRREFPTRLTQAIQLQAHRGLARAFENPGPLQAPWQLKLATRIPGIHSALGYAVGIGARPEHVREKATKAPRRSFLTTAMCWGVGLAVATVVVGWVACKTANVKPCAVR
jgi:hypothetical protein